MRTLTLHLDDTDYRDFEKVASVVCQDYLRELNETLSIEDVAVTALIAFADQAAPH